MAQVSDAGAQEKYVTGPNGTKYIRTPQTDNPAIWTPSKARGGVEKGLPRRASRGTAAAARGQSATPLAGPAQDQAHELLLLLRRVPPAGGQVRVHVRLRPARVLRAVRAVPGGLLPGGRLQLPGLLQGRRVHLPGRGLLQVRGRDLRLVLLRGRLLLRGRGPGWNSTLRRGFNVLQYNPSTTIPRRASSVGLQLPPRPRTSKVGRDLNT